MLRFLTFVLCLFPCALPLSVVADEGSTSSQSEASKNEASKQVEQSTPGDPPAKASQAEDLLARGETIYRESCQHCHGEKGQGEEGAYEEPLTGDLSVGELTQAIADTMPEEDPEACVGEDAAAVAAFVHEAFYSEAARVRNRPPRVVLSRLTGEQLRQSLADLYGSLGGSPWIENKTGLTGHYYDGKRQKQDDQKIERIDPVLDFDFGHEGPGEGIKPKEYSIRWKGSLRVPRSGRYELILRSSCSCVLDFGAWDRTLVNNHVQSQGKEEFRRSLHLTGGRAYPLTLSFVQRERKTEQPPAKVSLSWIPPGGQEEIIPSQFLLPTMFPAAFPLQAKLPPDDRSYGYERGTSVDRRWDESTTEAALEFAEIAIEELYPQYRNRHKKDDDTNRAVLRQFLGELVETAFRGPLDEKTRAIYIDRQVDSTEDDAEAIKRVLLVALKSPRFLYPTLDAHLDPSRRAANRLALVLFDSLPTDSALLKAASEGRLKETKQLEEAARRMFNDYRARAKVRSLLDHWFELADLQELAKDDEKYPGFDKPLVADLRKSFDRFVDEIVWSESSDFRQLLQADWMYTTERIAEFYGDAWKPQGEAEAAGLVRSVADPQVHVGLLTHPLLMGKLAYHDTSSPIHRGVFLTRHVLGRVLRPPNEAFTPLNPELHPELTTRQRVELQTGEVNCQVCHRKINSLGFALENFDAAGRFRSKENGKPIDASGYYVSRSGETIKFNGARELGNVLASNPDTHRAFVEAAFEHFVKQPVSAYGEMLSDELTESFRSSGYSIRDLIVRIAVIAAQRPAGNLQET